MAGGTGDIAFRVLRAIQAEERNDMEFQNVEDQEEREEFGAVTVFDINPEMLEEGKKKALSRRLGADVSLVRQNIFGFDCISRSNSSTYFMLFCHCHVFACVSCRRFTFTVGGRER